MLGAGDEVGERILFLEQLAVIVPFFAHLGAAANMCDRIDKAAVEQAEAIGRKARIDAVAVRAVAIKQQWAAAVALEGLAIDQRNRHFGAVGRRRENAFGVVLR